MRWLYEFFEGTLDLLLPNLCASCRQILFNNAFPTCPACAFFLERANLLAAQEAINKLPQGRDTFWHVLPLWVFDKAGTVQHIHQGLKYKNRPYTGIALGKLMGSKLILPLHPTQRPNLIIPIPLHKKRLLERGYNQSELLAQGIVSTTRIPMANHTLVRSLHTQTQTGLDRQERLKNVDRAFHVRSAHEVLNKHVLLVDDVLTTGATLLAASRPLISAGAAFVSITTFAMARF